MNRFQSSDALHDFESYNGGGGGGGTNGGQGQANKNEAYMTPIQGEAKKGITNLNIFKEMENEHYEVHYWRFGKEDYS